MILSRNIETFSIFYHFDSDPRFPPFLLYVRWKSRVSFVRRCFRDAQIILGSIIPLLEKIEPNVTGNQGKIQFQIISFPAAIFVTYLKTVLS